MAQKFCSRITRKLRRMGLGRKSARFFAGFFYVSMMVVCGLFGLLEGKAGLSYYPENGAGIGFADARPVPVMSAPFGIRRH